MRGRKISRLRFGCGLERRDPDPGAGKWGCGGRGRRGKIRSCEEDTCVYTPIQIWRCRGLKDSSEMSSDEAWVGRQKQENGTPRRADDMRKQYLTSQQKVKGRKEEEAKLRSLGLG